MMMGNRQNAPLCSHSPTQNALAGSAGYVPISRLQQSTQQSCAPSSVSFSAWSLHCTERSSRRPMTADHSMHGSQRPSRIWAVSSQVCR